ncbi:spore gernimation protein GerA [Brevibacillus fluminis]|uniref:Spore gernimation protein GerA n=1 Tax=Brevibacillus fluminis TaxID=511487 RepID=A0A3M8DW54_9BACL|nr:spore germination protein [Brevibacillus fluminis]RNB92322.1 spore gernimation protein GerA [Brevibacillus fluminis]
MGSVPQNFPNCLNDSLGNSSDLVIKEFVICQTRVYLCFLESLVDFPKTNEYVRQIESGLVMDEDIFDQLAALTAGQAQVPYSDIIVYLLKGRLVIASFHDDRNVVLNPLQISLTRDIQTPLNENVVQSSFDAFTENINTNIGIIRSKIISRNLVVESLATGETNTRQLAVIYRKDKVSQAVIDSILDRLRKNKNNNIRHVQDLSRALGQKKWNLIPTILSTEIPADTVEYLSEGRVAIFMDHFPFALVIPSIVSDLWSIKSDHNFPVVFMASIRIIRIVGLLVSTLAPGLYVALVSVNPEVLRIQLALAIARSREGVPYPAIIEIILLLFVLEMIVEASVRLPKSIGPAITMVGGIILGEAVVQAKLVSNLLIITLAATTIANFTLSGFTNMLMVRLFKYVLLLPSAIFGVLGLIGGLQFFCCYLAAVTTFSVPYLTLKMREGDRVE